MPRKGFIIGLGVSILLVVAIKIVLACCGTTVIIIDYKDEPDPFNPEKGEVTTISGKVYQSNFWVDGLAQPTITIRVNSWVLDTKVWEIYNTGWEGEWGFSASWDGKDAQGNILPPGDYRYVIEAYGYPMGYDIAEGTVTIEVTPDYIKLCPKYRKTVPGGSLRFWAAGFKDVNNTPLDETDDLGPFSVRADWSIKGGEIGSVSPNYQSSTTTFTAISSLPENKKEKISGLVHATYYTCTGEKLNAHAKIEVYPPGPVKVLLVDDDGGYAMEEPWIMALQANLADVRLVKETTDLATMSQYNIVVWNTGGNYYNGLSYYDIQNLKTYLDNGGRFLLSGSLTSFALNYYPYDVGRKFMREYLGAEFAGYDYFYGEKRTITGAGDTIGRTDTYTLTYTPEQRFSYNMFLSLMTPVADDPYVSPVFQGDQYPGRYLALKKATETYRTMIMGFELAQVVSPYCQVIEELTNRAIWWCMQEKPPEKPPKKPPEECFCEWTYSIKTNYIVPFVEDKVTERGNLKIKVEGAFIDAYGKMKFSGPYGDDIDGKAATLTFLSVKLNERCKGCKPKINLIGGVDGHVYASVVGTGNGRAHSLGRGAARHDLEYRSIKEVDMIVGSDKKFLHDEGIGEKEKSAFVSVISSYKGEMIAVCRPGQEIVLGISGVISHFVTINAKCTKEDGKECKGSLTIMLQEGGKSVTVEQDGVKKTLKAPEQGRGLKKWEDPN